MIQASYKPFFTEKSLHKNRSHRFFYRYWLKCVKMNEVNSWNLGFSHIWRTELVTSLKLMRASLMFSIKQKKANSWVYKMMFRNPSQQSNAWIENSGLDILGSYLWHIPYFNLHSSNVHIFQPELMRLTFTQHIL